MLWTLAPRAGPHVAALRIGAQLAFWVGLWPVLCLLLPLGGGLPPGLFCSLLGLPVVAFAVGIVMRHASGIDYRPDALEQLRTVSFLAGAVVLFAAPWVGWD